MFHVSATEPFDALSGEYRDLFARSDATAFQHPVWLHHLYGHLAPALDARPLVVTVRTGPERRLSLVLPLVRRGQVVSRIEFADLGVSDYAAPVCDPGLMATVPASSLQGAIRNAIGSADLVCIGKIAHDPDRMAHLLGGKPTRLGYDTHGIALRSPFSGWRSETLAPDFARHLTRKRKRLKAKGEIRLRPLDDPGEIDHALTRMRDFRRARFAQRRATDLMQDPRFFEFYRAVAIQSAREGGPGRTAALTVAGEVVAASFGLAQGERHLFLLLGFDFERFRNHSLGLLIVEDLIEDAIKRGQTMFDLTIGDEPYKADFAAQAQPVHTLSVARTWRGQMSRAAEIGHGKARKVAKGLLAEYARRSGPSAAHALSK